MSVDHCSSSLLRLRPKAKERLTLSCPTTLEPSLGNRFGTFQPIRATASLVQTGELEVVLPQWRGVPHEVYAAVASRLNLSPTVRELLAFVGAKLPEQSAA